MGTCSMCKKEIEGLAWRLTDGKDICKECSGKVKELLESNDPAVTRNAVNYIYTCAKNTSDKEVSEYLLSMLENNASAIEELQQADDEQKPVDFSKQADYFADKKSEDDSGTGFGGGFMKTVAWILWIGGFILSFAMSLQSEYRSTIFNWTLFFSSLSIYFFAGAFAMCMSELFSNVNTIKNEICKMNKKNK